MEEEQGALNTAGAEMQADAAQKPNTTEIIEGDKDDGPAR
jgi:hypothetical protein